MAEAGSLGTVLVADDEPLALDSVSALLTQKGYRVIACSNGADALEQLNKTDVDVVVSDIRMPAMSGIELLENIVAFSADTPVILMTAFADMTTAIDAIKKRAFDFIVKPFHVDQLIHSIDKAMQYKRLLKIEEYYKNLLEEFNRELETMVSERTMSLMALTVADRVRNPATTIGRICRRILEKELLSPEARANIGDVIEESEKLEKIVSDFHYILKSRQSSFSYENINEIVKSSVAIAQKEAGEKGVVLLESLSEKPLRINAQKSLLDIAVSQLIRNAIEATSQDGIVAVSTEGDTERVILTVTDTGHGIPPEHIDKIFDPFFSTREKRFGMGLALVKQIINEHLAEMTVESNPGKGTVFRIVFPARWREQSLAAREA